MATVPALLKERWFSKELVGAAAHSCLVRIRPGVMNRLYQTTTMLDTHPGPKHQKFPLIWKGDNATPWQAQWTPSGDWQTLTNIQSANWTRSFQDQGSSTLTVVIDNIAFNDQTGAGGTYHSIDRGWFSPTRGVKTTGRPAYWPSNAWDDVFNSSWQIEIWEGYGQGSDVVPVEDGTTHHWTAPSASKTFTGLIETCDMESHPDHITLTCTGFEVMLTDQRVMGQNKATEIQAPITFADRKKSKGSKTKGWILVDDAADVVRMVLLWAGFHEFDVQNFGWTLQAPMQFGQDSFLIDIINAILLQGNYCFFMDAPSDHDMSIGMPVFRPQSATKAPSRGMLTVQDTQMTEALEVIWDASNLPYILRFRGAVSDQGTASPVLGDTVKRWTGTYWPPWSGHDYTNLQGKDFVGTFPAGRVSGVRRQFSQTDTNLDSVAQCLFACILATIQYALQAVTGTFQIPGLPGVSLDQQVSLVDEGTGTNSRMWTASIDSQHTLGPGGNWHMTVGGSMIDTEDMNLIAEDYKFTYERYVAERGD